MVYFCVYSFVVFIIGSADVIVNGNLVAPSVFCFRSIMLSRTWIKLASDVVL